MNQEHIAGDNANISNLTPLCKWVKQASDQYIIETMANISAKPRWECNEATWVLKEACIKEWQSRHSSSPMSTIISEKEMILTSTSKNKIL